jgi:hypothetical protein
MPLHRFGKDFVPQPPNRGFVQGFPGVSSEGCKACVQGSVEVVPAKSKGVRALSLTVTLSKLEIIPKEGANGGTDKFVCPAAAVGAVTD